MSDIVSEVQLEEELRRLHAAGDYPGMVDLAEGYRNGLSARNQHCRFDDPATTYQYMVALSRVGRLEEALSIRWRDMAGWSGFTPEKLGDWYRDGHARYFLAKGDTIAAKGAVGDAMKLHLPGSPKHLLDRQVLAIVPVVQNRLPAALKRIRAIVAEIEQVDFENRQEFCSVERLATWWLLLLSHALGAADDEQLSRLTGYVVRSDASERRRDLALKLSATRKHAKLARKAIKYEIKKG